MHFGILGGLRVDAAGTPLDLGGPKQRTVLASLVLALGRPVSADVLQDHVWGDRPPANPETSLQAYISNLRRTLEPGRKPREPARVLVTQPAGYALVVPRANVDATAFEDQVRAGRAALAAGDAARARQELTAALALWTGPPLPELAGAGWVDEATAWLEGVRRQALEASFDAGLALGEHSELVPDLQRAIGEHPFHERLHAQLALALYRSGRQRDALDVLARARTVLRDEVGIEPGIELKRLEADILDQAPTLDRAPSPVPAPPPPAVVEAETESSPDTELDSGPSFVGRRRELDALLEAAGAAAQRSGRPVVVSGEPGIGKTRLVEELVSRLPATTVVAWGRCPESAAGAAYWPCIQIGRQLEGADALRADAVADLLPAEDVQAQTDDPTADRLGLHVSVVKTLATATRPLVLVVDDLQWADPSSLRVIEFVAGELRSLPVLLIVTARPTTPDASPALIDCLGELARQPGALRLDLGGLSGDEVRRWIEGRAGGRTDPRVAQVVLDRTGGNPFFVGEVVELLSGAGTGPDLDIEGLRRAVPAAVQDVVRRRVSRLPVSTQQALSTASVLGRVFDLDVLAAVADVPVTDLLDQLDPALSAGLIEDTDLPGRFQFAHALVADTLAVEITPARRARLHASAALALASLRQGDLEGNLADMAHHAVEGSIAGTAPQAYEWSVLAARQASNRLAHEDAAGHWARAVRAVELARPGDGLARFEALEEQGRAWLRVDAIEAGYEALVAAIDQAIALGDPALVGRAAAAMSIDGVWHSGEVALTAVDAVSGLERALTALPETPTVERVMALGAMAEAAYWKRPPEWLDAMTAEGIAAARALGDPVALGRALHKRNQALWRAATLDERATAAEEFIGLVEAHDLPPALEALARFGMAGVDWERAAVPAALAQASRAQVLAQKLGSPALLTQLDYFHATIAGFMGRLEEAEALADRAHDLYRRTRRWSADTLGVALKMPAWMEQGRGDEIDRQAHLLIDSPYRPWFQEGYAYALVEQGRLDEAAAVIDGASPPLVDCWLFLGVVGAATHVRVALGDHDAATTLCEHLRPYEGRLLTAGTGSAFGDTHLALAAVARLLGDDDEARRHADASVAVLGAAGAGPDLVRALLLRADVRPEGADADRARAFELVERFDLTLLRDRFR